MRRAPGTLARDTKGAVAPTVALSLFGLIAAGGLAFDYARLASLDTELQNAADQAALAAATQLDRQAGSTARAVAAAQSLLVNQTRFGNDGGGLTILTGQSYNDASGNSVARVTFYSTKADAEAGTNGYAAATANDSLARFVKVDVSGREAVYALTPIVGALRSGTVNASAVAGVGSSICKIPPLMMCNPQEVNSTSTFNAAAYKGIGIRLVEGGGGGAAWTAGNFGYLQTGMGPGASVLEYALGANNPPGNCLAVDGVTTKPGENTSVTDAINTRFDIYENGLTNDCTTGTCSPSTNVRKDVVRPAGSTNFGLNGNDAWEAPERPYLPTSATAAYSSPYPTAMGHPRDQCHAVSSDGECANSRIGDGAWDRNLYFYVNHRASGVYTPAVAGTPDNGWMSIPSLKAFAEANGYTTSGLNPTIANITRYDVYRWEIAHDALQDTLEAYADHTDSKGTTFNNYARPQSSPGLAAGPNQRDRRMISMAVVNCQSQNVQGQAKDVTVVKWVDLFIVEPSIPRARTSAGDIYVEVIRETTAGGSAPTAPQVVRHDVPYLIK